MSRNTRFQRARVLTGALCILFVLLSGTLMAADPVSYSICDIRVLYLYDDPSTIDWPTVYYLNDHYACRVDLLTIRPGGEFRVVTTGIKNRELFSHRAYGDLDDPGFVTALYESMFRTRRPDIVIFGDIASSKKFDYTESYILNLPRDEGSVFDIAKIYRLSSTPSGNGGDDDAVVINSAELLDRYRDRMELEIPQLFPGTRIDGVRADRLTRYSLAKNNLETVRPGPDFVTGLPTLRLVPLLESMLPEGAVRTALVSKGRNFTSFFAMAVNSNGSRRVDNLVTGYKDMIALGYQIAAERTLTTKPDFMAYIKDLSNKAQEAVLGEINLDWHGNIIWRDSPHGPRLKFRASLAVNGPEEVELSYVRFHPYWDSTTVELESESRKVTPHQMFVREYLIDVDREHLESRMPESLTFSAEIVYAQIQLPVITSIAVRERPDLSITFMPDFHFVPPAARVEVDKVVRSMNWKAVISKPADYAGEVTVRLETPRGVFAGAYKTDWILEKGRTTETIRIPFSVSNLFEMGVHPQTITLENEGLLIAADTGFVRLASCKIDDKVKVGFLPDSTGILEDILRMTDATYQPLTDRSFVTADLDAYNVIAIGSGSFRDYPSLGRAKDRLEDYLRYGGSLIVFGQPSDWPEGILPVSMVPGLERVRRSEITNRIPSARVLSNPYDIGESGLLSYFDRERRTSPAVISPAERVYITGSGATLLSVSRIGDGQIIYCGLPLLEMIGELNLDAIHLFANLLNY